MINGHSAAYLDAAIQGEVARLSAAEHGERNNSLFRSAAALSSLGLREGEILHHLKPAADVIGLKGKEFYSTLKSGVKAGQASPRQSPTTVAGRRFSPNRPGRSLPLRSPSNEPNGRPAYYAGGDEGPRRPADEVRRHVYKRDGVPVRIKIKRQNGYTNWYRVVDQGVDGWQAGKPEGYQPCPYIGAVDPFDRELSDDVIYWPEGEKDCDELGLRCFPAFTFGGTGDGLPGEIDKYLRGRRLVILSDNDASGRAHAIKKAEFAQGIAASIKIVEFPELPAGADVSDFLKANSAEAFEGRVEAQPAWAPSNEFAGGCNEGSGLVACDLSDIAPEKVEWLWSQRVAIGKIAIIGGEPGLGKSQVSLAIAAAVTTGGYWPLGAGRSPTGSVVVLSAEDGLGDTVRPRFDAAGGDPLKVRVIRAVRSRGTGRRSFNLNADVSLLENEIKARGDVRLVLIDPISSYMGKTDSHKNAEVRAVLEPLGDMAERLRVAVVAITHLSKGDGKAINRFMGSIAFVAAARTAFAVVADPDDDFGGRRLLLPVKNNIAAPMDGLAFHLAQREVADGVIGSHVVWDETAPVKINVDQALAGNREHGEGTATDEAVELLREILAAGPADVLDIEAEARAAAMLSDTKRLNASKPFRSAATALGIIKRRQGFGPGARIQWSLPNINYQGEGM